MRFERTRGAVVAFALGAAGCPAAEAPEDPGPDSVAVVQGVGTTSHDGLELRVRIGGPAVAPARVSDGARELRVMHGPVGPAALEGEN